MGAKIKLIVSGRGQITLPAVVRKKFGIEEGSVLVAEDRDGEIVLKPTSVMEVDYYSDEQIKSWVADDSYSSSKERDLTRLKLRKVARKK